VWDKLEDFRRATDALALDRKHVLITLFNRIAQAARGRGTRAA